MRPRSSRNQTMRLYLCSESEFITFEGNVKEKNYTVYFEFTEIVYKFEHVSTPASTSICIPRLPLLSRNSFSLNENH